MRPSLHRFSFVPSPDDIYARTAITIETRAVGLDEVVEAMETYLKAAGFHFEGRVLDIVPDDFGTPAPEKLGDQ